MIRRVCWHFSCVLLANWLVTFHQLSMGVLHGEESSFRGGTIRRPAGLGLLNRAPRRCGIISTQFSLEIVQILLLQGT
jgi:hypothetical protein